jgi:hypothetical protein
MRVFGLKKYLLCGLFLAVMVLLYNCWSYMCGKTTLSMLINLGPTAIALIICNILAALILLLIKTTRTEDSDVINCSCGKKMEHSGWKYCPQCGEQISI